MNTRTRPIIIAGNWKMNHGLKDTTAFFSALKRSWADSISGECLDKLQSGEMQGILFLPATSLDRGNAAKENLPLSIGAQNVHWEVSGAFTGEVSGPMVRDLGVEHVLVGHSERRQYFGETDQMVNKRAKSLLGQGFHVMVCIGETKEERESGQTAKVLETQLAGAFPDDDGEFFLPYFGQSLSIAYEPVWAIGTGLTATPEQAEEAHQIIRKDLVERYGMIASGKTPILYGGSVKPDNISILLSCPNIDGALVGGASLKPESFLSLLSNAK